MKEKLVMKKKTWLKVHVMRIVKVSSYMLCHVRKYITSLIHDRKGACN